MQITTPSRQRPASPASLQRARGRVRATLGASEDGTTHVIQLFQEGCLKARLLHTTTEGEADVVVINTSGGLTGGDRLSMEVTAGEAACATVTTPACERIYRSNGGEAFIEQRVRVARGARLDWIPQETILYDQARLRRRLDVEIERDAEVTLSEAILFGRTAMGETVKTGHLLDFWTVRQDGRLLFVDSIRVTDCFENTTAGPATLHGNTAMASLVHVGQDLETKRDALRAIFSRLNGATAGASVVGEVLVTRIVAPAGRTLREWLIPALGVLRDRRALPRNWLC